MVSRLALFLPYYFLQAMKGEKLDESELEALQNQRLRKIVTHAYANVPYYRRLFDSVGVHPQEIRTKQDLIKIPITRKEDLQKLPVTDRLAKGIDLRKCIMGRTSGSTGQPLDVIFSARELAYRVAVQTRRVYGFNLFSKKFNILERDPAPSQGSPALIFGKMRALMNLIGLWRRYYFSLFDEPEELVERLLQIKPDIIETYPSVLKLMAKVIRESGINGVQVKKIFTEAELLNEADREDIETVFGGELIDLYGAVEFGIFAWQCKHRQGYHINADMVIVEALRGNEQVYEEEGEAVVTDLTNYTMPFIRYSLGDVIRLSEGRHNCCSNFPVIKLIEGRSNDFLTLPSGKIVSPLPLGVLLEKIEGVAQYRLVQQRKDLVYVEVVKGRNFNEQTLEKFRDALLAVFGSEVEVVIDIVPEIKREKSGKIRPIVSCVPVSM